MASDLARARGGNRSEPVTRSPASPAPGKTTRVEQLPAAPATATSRVDAPVQRKGKAKPPPDWTGKLVETMVATQAMTQLGMPSATTIDKGRRGRVVQQASTVLQMLEIELEGVPAPPRTAPERVWIARSAAHVVDEAMLPGAGEREDEVFFRDFKVVFARVLDEFERHMPGTCPTELRAGDVKALFSAGQRKKLMAFFQTRLIPDELFTGPDATGSITPQQRVLLAGEILATGHNEERLDGDAASAPGKPRARNCGHWAGWVWIYAGVHPAGGTPSSNQGNIMNVVGPTGAAVFGSGARDPGEVTKADPDIDGRRRPIGYPDEANMAEIFTKLEVGDWIWIDNRGAAGHSEIFAGWVKPDTAPSHGKDAGPRPEKESDRKKREKENEKLRAEGKPEIPPPERTQPAGTRLGQEVQWKRAKVYSQRDNGLTEAARWNGPGGGDYHEENLGFPYSETAASDGRVCPVTQYTRPGDKPGQARTADQLLPFDRDAAAAATHAAIAKYPAGHGGAEIDLGRLHDAMAVQVEALLTGSTYLAKLDPDQQKLARSIVDRNRAATIFALTTLFALVQRLSLTDKVNASDPGRPVTGVFDPGKKDDLALIGVAAAAIEKQPITSLVKDELSFPIDTAVEGNRVAISRLGDPEAVVPEVMLELGEAVRELIGKRGKPKDRYDAHAAKVDGILVAHGRSTANVDAALEDLSYLVAVWQFVRGEPVTGYPDKLSFGKLVAPKTKHR